MKDAYRFDRGSLRPPRETSQGFLRVDGHATRIGVLEYDDAAYPDGIRRELRLPEDLFDAASLASYEGAPITDDHPPEMVTPANVTAYAKGTVLSAARRDGDHVAVSFQITDGNTINKARNGKVELSTGYRVKLDETPGVHPEYGRYDVRQRNIVVNHLAIVSAGRAGPTARIRMDSVALTPSARAFVDQLRVQRIPAPAHKDTNQMTIKDTENLQAQIAQAATLLATEKARADQAEAKLSGEKTRADTAEGQVNALNASIVQLRAERRDDNLIAAKDAEIKAALDRADKAEKALLAVPDQIVAGIKARVDLERDASRVCGPEVKFDGMTDREVMLLALEKRGHAVESNRSDAHVGGVFKAVVDSWQAGEDALARIANATTAATAGTRTDSRPGSMTVKSAHAQMVARNRGLATS